MNPAADNLSTLLDPREIETYLLARGWEVRRQTPMFSTWDPPRGTSARTQLFLPLSPKPRDFESRLRDLVWRLAEIEGEDRDVLVTNLRYASADLVRVRLVSPRVGSGELPIGDGAHLFEGAKDLMLAAACAAINVRPNFGPRVPRRASDYLDGVRLGQTERGSYVVTVISDVAAPAQRAILPDDAAYLEIPFERQVTTRLVTALGAARNAAHSVLHESGNYGVFDDAVEEGVSANLCDAIATMGTENAGANVQVSVEWASSRPSTVEVPPKIAFDPAALPVVREAVAHLRQLGPFDNELVEGFVSRLTRGNEDEIGTIVIEGETRDEKRNVHVELPDDQYDLAVEAHRTRHPVRIRGTLYKRGRSWVLSEPGQLVLED
jgi:hypothetical protein